MTDKIDKYERQSTLLRKEITQLREKNLKLTEQNSKFKQFLNILSYSQYSENYLIMHRSEQDFDTALLIREFFKKEIE